MLCKSCKSAAGRNRTGKDCNIKGKCVEMTMLSSTIKDKQNVDLELEWSKSLDQKKIVTVIVRHGKEGSLHKNRRPICPEWVVASGDVKHPSRLNKLA